METNVVAKINKSRDKIVFYRERIPTFFSQNSLNRLDMHSFEMPTFRQLLSFLFFI